MVHARTLDFRLLTLAALSAVAGSACGDQGSYELHWTLACPKDTPPPCTIRSVKECSSLGVDAIEAVARRGADATRTTFPCFSPASGAAGTGPGLDAGQVDLEVATLSSGGQRLSGPVTVPAVIPDSGAVQVNVELPRPRACADGVDNDGDGLVDLTDPGCTSPDGSSEVSAR